MVMSGGLAGRLGNADRRDMFVERHRHDSILASIFMRLCAWRALEALALKRSTKVCMCARAASCFLAKATSSARLAARVSTKVS